MSAVNPDADLTIDTTPVQPAAPARATKYEYPVDATAAQKKAIRRDARKAARQPAAQAQNSAADQVEALIESFDEAA